MPNNRKLKNLFTEYCTGCGLCHSTCDVEMRKDKKGWYRPVFSGYSQIESCKKMCPASGSYLNYFNSSEIWGKSIGIFLGYSKDEEVRYKASSGGGISSTLIFLLDHKIVDGIIQVKASEDVPYETTTIISRNRDDIISCMGSRYSSSAPLYNIKSILKENEKYCFVGKPCDVSALRLYVERDKILKDKIILYLSFFCAGVPSELAQKKLIKTLCTDKCLKLKYRGDGWPGYTTAIDIKGDLHTISYTEAWGSILGRDIRKCCRFCFDGIGDFADLVYGDAWYLDEGKKPIFEEENGRNVIIARTPAGYDILKSAEKCKYLKLIETDFRDLKYMQPYQYERKATMIGKILALKLLFKDAPRYKLSQMLRYSGNTTILSHIKILWGTMARIKINKI